MIAIVDYEMGNIGSVYNMLKKIGKRSVITNDPAVIESAEKIILPGVGSFDSGMTNLENLGLVELLRKKVLGDKIPILGICLGAQLMLNKSEEGVKNGLGFVEGDVVRFQIPENRPELRVPSMGWNQVAVQKSSGITNNLPENPRYYFVHSYHFKLKHAEDDLMDSEYAYTFCSAFEHANIAGVQFHPEKSHKFGMALLKNFTENF